MGIHRSRQDICKRTLRKVYDRRKDVRGLVAAALTETAASPASHADLPARHAWAMLPPSGRGCLAAAMAAIHQDGVRTHFQSFCRMGWGRPGRRPPPRERWLVQ